MPLTSTKCLVYNIIKHILPQRALTIRHGLFTISIYRNSQKILRRASANGLKVSLNVNIHVHVESKDVLLKRPVVTYLLMYTIWNVS